ncbi:hypothetical protein OSTOST_10292, partial [Ostertagia ostertagi]
MATFRVLLYCSGATGYPGAGKVAEFKTDLEIRFGLYIAFGLVTFSSLSYLLGHLWSPLNGLSFVLAGAFRDEALLDDFYYKRATGMDCLLRTPWGLMMVVAGQIPALLHLFVALDKIIAFRFINLYREQPLIFRKEAYVAMTAILTVAPSPGELRRQNMILSLDLLSVVLVSIPNLALILNQWKVPAMNPLLV